MYFSKAKKLAGVIFSLSGFSFILAIICLFKGGVELFTTGLQNQLREAVLLAVFLSNAVIFLLLGIALMTVVKDAKEDLYYIEKRINKLENK